MPSASSLRARFRQSRLYAAFYRYYREHPWMASAWATLRRNRVRLDGCRFRIDAPGMSHELRAEFVMGRYEYAERQILREHLDPGSPVIELGAGVGVLACLVNRRLTHPDQHVIIEANPILIPRIETNRALNDCRFTLRHLAYAANTTALDFSVRGVYTISAASSITPPAYAEAGTVTRVAAISLRRLADEAGFPVFGLICDVEGSEFELIETEADVLASRVSLFVVEFHTPPDDRSLSWYVDRLATCGFESVAQAGRVQVFRNRQIAVR